MIDSNLINIAKSEAELLITKLGLEAEIEVETSEVEEKQYIEIKIKGENLGELIGYHGKNIDAIQKILSLIVDMGKKEDDAPIMIIVDVNNYRKDRTDYLTKLAQTAAQEAIETNQVMELPAMKPYERRAVHMALQNMEGITTESIGEDHDRRVQIKPI